MKFFKIFFIFCIFYLTITVSAFSAQIGIASDTDFFEKIKVQNIEKTILTKNDFNTLSWKNTPILIFQNYSWININILNSIKTYLHAGGKLILIAPQKEIEYSNFEKLANLVGVKFDGIKKTKNKNTINWVEETIGNNDLDVDVPIASLLMDENTIHLAVFGDIEKHEPAITYNSNGAVIAWQIFKDGNKKFNEKSFTSLLMKYLPKDISKHYPFLFNANEEISKLEEKRKFLTLFQDNIINYTSDVSKAQENLEMAKVSALQANFYANKNNIKLMEKYIEDADKYICKSTCGLNSLSPAENIGIWFDRGTIVEIKSKNEMSKIFDKLKSAGISTVYFETFNAGYTIYPSKITSQNPLTKGRDPLAWAIEEAHKRGIKIQSWLWIFAVGNDRHNKIIRKSDDFVGPVLSKNMRFALLGENGNFRPKKQPEFWIDPSNKEGIEFLLKLADEITKNYNIDGIQLDYIRYPFQSSNNLMGFNHNSTEQFTSNTGEKLFDNNPEMNSLWNKWKEENINKFVKKISLQTKQINPNLKISASIFAKNQDERLNSIQQNYENWIENKYIDFLTPMSYSISENALHKNLAILEPQIASCLIYPGIALQHVDNVKLLKQLSIIRAQGFSGVSLFAVAQLSNDKAEIMNFLNSTTAKIDPSYNMLLGAELLINDYSKALMTIYSNDYTLSNKQKQRLNSLQANTQNLIYYISNNQINLALKSLENLKKEHKCFFRKYPNNNEQRYLTLNTYLDKTENLLKIILKNK